ncbi:MAG: hypothetical protein AAF658_01710, partial [Myxococcota bacterium]
MRRKPVKIVIDSLIQLASVYAGYVLIGFGFDKVLGINSSIAGFKQIGAGLGVDPTAFRYFVGAQEIGVSLALFAAALVFLPERFSLLQTWARRVYLAGSVGLVATMVGALATEAIVRPGEQNWLVYLAIRLGVIGVFASAWALRSFGLGRLGRLFRRAEN